MDSRSIVAQTLENMVRIYEDVGAVMRLIEEKVKSRPGGHQPLGNADVMWEASRALDQPRWWLYRYFGRAYVRDDRPETVIGFSIHLGQYSADELNGAHLPLAFPFLNASRLQMSTRAKECSRPDVLNGLWAAGWHRGFKPQTVRGSRLVAGTFAADWRPALSTMTFFVDLLELNSEDVVERTVVEPMVRLLEGDETWVSDGSRRLWELQYPGL